MLICDTLELPEEAVQRLLPLCKLIPADVIRAEEASGTVDDQQSVARFAEDTAHLRKQLFLMLSVVCSGVGYILKHILLVEAVPLGNGHEPLRSECALRVYVERLALAAPVLYGQLAGYAKCVAELGLPATEFAKDLRDLPRFNTAPKEAVQLCRARGQLDHIPAHLQHLRSADHAHRHQLPRSGHDPLGLLVANALNLLQFAHRHEGYGFHAMDAMFHQRGDVCFGKARTLVRRRCTKTLKPGDAWLVALNLLGLRQLPFCCRSLVCFTH
mmetsp:Transcript_104242/g.290371  ORF Transcript_104242/g.290371 Transcript_104242/m.290371 type:complete len:271 (+) Transcript_104242:482-1294(+)